MMGPMVTFERKTIGLERSQHDEHGRVPPRVETLRCTHRLARVSFAHGPRFSENQEELVVVPRALAKPVFALPIDYMMSISKSPPDQTRSHAPTMRQIAKQVSNSETLLQALLDEFGVHALRYSSDMPVMDARCRHRTTPPDATPDFWKGTLDLSGKVFCSVPECKDCEASKEPWSLSGFDRCPRDAMSCSDKDICGEHKDLYRMVFIPGAPDNVSTVQTDAVLD